MINNIDSRFSAGMAKMGNRGRVVLTSSDDISEYRISVKVSFRAGEELQALSGQRQSGGERAVSTMLFLLSMQADTPLPFRILDEINQGMDVPNERRIMEELVKAVAEMVDQNALSAKAQAQAAAVAAAQEGVEYMGGSAKPVQRDFARGRQLFIISPKLMPDLHHHPTMRTSIVYNGPQAGAGPRDASALCEHFTKVDFSAIARGFDIALHKDLMTRVADKRAINPNLKPSAQLSAAAGSSAAVNGSISSGGGKGASSSSNSSSAAAQVAIPKKRKSHAVVEDDEEDEDGDYGSGAAARVVAPPPANKRARVAAAVSYADDDDGFDNEDDEY